MRRSNPRSKIFFASLIRTRGFLYLFFKTHHVCLDEIIYLAIHYRAYVTYFVIGTVVFYHLIWVEHVRTYLRTPLNFFRAAVAGVFQFLAFAQLLFVEAAFQHGQCFFAVLALCTCLLTLYNDAAWYVLQTYGSFYLVYVLSAFTTCAVKFPFQIGRANSCLLYTSAPLPTLQYLQPAGVWYIERDNI